MSTLKKISEIAGCSVSTVSRALNNCNDVSEKTRNNILKIANKLGYFQRKKKIKLENRKKNKFNIAILCPEIESSYYSRMIIDLLNELSLYDSSAVIYDYSFDFNKLAKLISECHDDNRIDATICLDKVNNVQLFDDMMFIAFGMDVSYSSFFNDIADRITEIFEQLEDNDVIYMVSEDRSISQEVQFSRVAKNYPNVVAKKYISSKRFEDAGNDAGEYFTKRNILPKVVICAYDEIALGSDSVETIANTLSQVAAVRVLEGADALSSYGLEEPAYTITMESEIGVAMTLYIGEAAGDNYYATTNDKVVVYTIGSSAVSAMEFDVTVLEAEEETTEEGTEDETSEDASEDTTETQE